MIAMSDSRENYVNFGNPKFTVKTKVIEGKSIHKFGDIPFGEYAIKVYHDEDSDGKLNRSFIGMPSEDYGFSNNATGSFGLADYDDTKFIFDKSNIEIIISVD